MFTLKFQSNSRTETVCGSRYAISFRGAADGPNQPTRYSFAIISVYPKLTTEEGGVDFEVGGDRGFDVCYIENVSGKTIDRVGPFEEPEEFAVVGGSEA